MCEISVPDHSSVTSCEVTSKYSMFRELLLGFLPGGSKRFGNLPV